MFTKRNILTAEQRSKGGRNRWANKTVEERANHALHMKMAQAAKNAPALDIDAIIKELEIVIAEAKVAGHTQTTIKAITALGQWHRLKEYRASKGNQPATEAIDIDPGTLAELEKNALARQERDDEKLN